MVSFIFLYTIDWYKTVVFPIYIGQVPLLVHILIQFQFFKAIPWKQIYSRYGYSNETEIVADPFESMHRIAVCKRPLKIIFGQFRLDKTINWKNVTFGMFRPSVIRFYVYYLLEHRSWFRLWDRIVRRLGRIVFSIEFWKYANESFHISIDALQRNVFITWFINIVFLELEFHWPPQKNWWSDLPSSSDAYTIWPLPTGLRLVFTISSDFQI